MPLAEWCSGYHVSFTRTRVCRNSSGYIMSIINKTSVLSSTLSLVINFLPPPSFRMQMLANRFPWNWSVGLIFSWCPILCSKDLADFWAFSSCNFGNSTVSCVCGWIHHIRKSSIQDRIPYCCMIIYLQHAVALSKHSAAGKSRNSQLVARITTSGSRCKLPFMVEWSCSLFQSSSILSGHDIKHDIFYYQSVDIGHIALNLWYSLLLLPLSWHYPLNITWFNVSNAC